MIHETATVEEDVTIGEGTNVWHYSHIMPGARIGEECNLGQSVFVDRDVTIGNNVKIQNNVSVYKGVTLEDGVFCGPSMVFTNVDRPRSVYPTDESEYLETHVGEGATIGANATVICGNDLGRWCLVGAGSVVTKNVLDYAVVYGNPASIQGWSCECGYIYSEPQPVDWTCAECGIEYETDGDSIRPVK